MGPRLVSFQMQLGSSDLGHEISITLALLCSHNLSAAFGYQGYTDAAAVPLVFRTSSSKPASASHPRHWGIHRLQEGMWDLVLRSILTLEELHSLPLGMQSPYVA